MRELVSHGLVNKDYWGCIALEVRAGKLLGHVRLDQTIKLDAPDDEADGVPAAS